MPRVVLAFALLLCLLPATAKADGIQFGNQFGSVTILPSGITSRQSELKSFGGMFASTGHAFGRVYFATGALTSGSIWTGGTFSGIGSVFDVIGRGKWMKQLPGLAGEKSKVALFTGAFVGPISWTLVASHNFFHQYQLTGVFQGTLWNGRVVSGTTTQTINTFWNQEKGDNMGSIHVGTTSLSTPEPGSFGLLGIGLLAMVGLFGQRMAVI